MAGPIIRLKAMKALTGLSRATIYNRMNVESPYYDPAFPKRIQLGDSPGSAIGWYRGEVETWLASLEINREKETSARAALEIKTPKTRATPTQKGSTNAVRQSRSPNESNTSELTIGMQFANCLVGGIKQNDCLVSYLRLNAWTPIMAVMLACGIKAPTDCNELPCEGEGLDGTYLGGDDSRFNQARYILNTWKEQFVDFDENDVPYSIGNLPDEISPTEFFSWCHESKVDTDWLRLLQELAGSPVRDSVKHLQTTYALQISKSVQPVGSANYPEDKVSRMHLDELAQDMEMATPPSHKASARESYYDKRNKKIFQRQKELRTQGHHAFNDVLAKEFGVTKERIVQIIAKQKKKLSSDKNV